MSKHSAISATKPVVNPVAATVAEKDKVAGLRHAAKASDLSPDQVKEAATEAAAPEESPAPAPKESEPEPGPVSLAQALCAAAAAPASLTKPCAKCGSKAGHMALLEAAGLGGKDRRRLRDRHDTA